MSAAPLILTNSRASSFLACPRRHWWAYELGIRPKRDGEALTLGSAYHAGLEALNKGAAVDDAARLAMSDTLNEPNRTIAGGLVSGWAWRWSNDPVGKILASERVFEFAPKKRARWSISGKIDAIAELPDGRIAVVEYKTMREDVSPTSDYWRRLLIDRQISFYLAGARSLGFDAVTVMYDIARVPGIRPKLVDRKSGERETPEVFADRLAQDISERPDWYYARHEIPRLDSDIASAIDDAEQISKMILTARKANRWPRNTNACRQWGVCPYFNPCADDYNPLTSGVPAGYSKVENVNVELCIDGEPQEEEQAP